MRFLKQINNMTIKHLSDRQLTIGEIAFGGLLLIGMIVGMILKI